MDIYREQIIELYKNPLNFGKIESPSLHSKVSNKSCGDKIELYILIKDDKIEDIKFDGVGCALSVASASLITEELKGNNIEEIGKITKEKIIETLGIDLSKNPTRMKCSLMILDGLKGLEKK